MLHASRKRCATPTRRHLWVSCLFGSRAQSGLDWILQASPAPINMNNMQTFLENLRTTAWRTAGARFNAARRLKRRDWFATFSIAMFSAISVGLAVVQKIYALRAGTPIDNYVTALAVSIGLFVIVISLIEGGAGNSVKADSLHRSGKELNAFWRQLDQRLSEAAGGHPCAAEEVTALREEYEEIKDRCPYNHEPVDDLLFLAEHRLGPEFADRSGNPTIPWFGERWIRLRSLLNAIWYFSLFWIVISVLLWFTVWRSV